MRAYVELMIAQTKTSVRLHTQAAQDCEDEGDPEGKAYHRGAMTGGYAALHRLRAILDRCPVVQVTNDPWDGTLVSVSNDDNAG
jgi:hypothetical protein